MSKSQQNSLKILTLIKSFKTSLRKYFGNNDPKNIAKESKQSFYLQAKRAETQERNLVKALQLYIRAIQKGQKKDSSIKDFASSLHQLGYTNDAVKLMDECVEYYDGNKEKYFRLRDNLEIQIRPTGKHLCKYLLIQNISQDLKHQLTEQQVKNLLFRSPKRIKSLKFLRDFQLLNYVQIQTKKEANNILVEFESFSAAKKTLQSFYFEEWFGSNLYWVNSKDMRIMCAAFDGKHDFQEGFFVNEKLIEEHIDGEKESFWRVFGENIYQRKDSNGFINLLSTHLIKDELSWRQKDAQEKENIFESSKIRIQQRKQIQEIQKPNNQMIYTLGQSNMNISANTLRQQTYWYYMQRGGYLQQMHYHY